MNISDMAALVNQVQGRPVVVPVGRPGFTVIVLGYRVRDIQFNDGLFQVSQVLFIRELGVVVADDDQAFIFVFVMPFPQRGNNVPAVNSTKGPHVDGNDFSTQVGKF